MFKKFLQYILFSVVSFVLILLFFIGIVILTMGPRVANKSLLVLDLSGTIMEEGPQSFRERLLVGDVLTTRDIILALDKAKRDSRIRGLLVTAMNANMGFGK